MENASRRCSGEIRSPAELQPGPHRLRISNTLYWKTVDFHVRTGEQVFFEAISHMGPGSIFMVLLLGVGPLYMTIRRMF